MLVGRKSERDRIARLLDAARLGRTAALVLRGEAGIGKSALLAWAEEQAWDMRVLHAHGVERDAELLFAGVLELCKPILDELEAIPERQAALLRSALTLGPVVPGDRFTASAATMSLLAAAAEEKPLLVVVDDAHWLDAASADALLFAARRLAADSVAFLFAVREREAHAFHGTALEDLQLRGLEREAAFELLTAAAGVRVAPTVRERLHEASGGNPLALVEFTGALSRDQLAGTQVLPEPLPVGERLESAFARTAELVHGSARRALLLAAADWTEDFDVVRRASRSLAVSDVAFDEAVDSGLVRLDGRRLAFRHPLVRSSIYQAAAPAERRRAHRALADALPDRAEERAWHLAAATIGPDEAVAYELEQVARRAGERSGYAAAAAAFERAARLSVGNAQAARRLFEAAQAAALAGRTRDAIRLLEEALPDASDPRLRTEIVALRGRLAHLDARPDARELLLEAAALAESIDPGRAVMILADVLESYVFAAAPDEMLEIARRMEVLAAVDDERQQFRANLALGGALQECGRYEEGAEHLGRALEIVRGSDAIEADPYELAHACLAPMRLGRTEEANELARRAISRAREQSAIGVLPFVLRLSASFEFSRGNWRQAYAAAVEGAELARETGQTSFLCGCLVQLALIEAGQGNATACQEHALDAVELASARELTTFRLQAEHALALLALLTRRPRDAADRLDHVVDDGGVWVASDLVEAWVRSGELERAREACTRHMIRAEQMGSLFRPLLSRCNGLIAGDHDFNHHFERALALHRELPEPFEEARTRLCYGERLRRIGERRRAREELRAALATFEAFGAVGWATRAVEELRASGERLRRRDPDSAEQLTGQELQIALAVAEARSNRDVAAALFLSPKTVEWHLTRIYRKLDVSSRAELVRFFATGRVQGQPPVATDPRAARAN
jgi:DNA-binding CsgD family transcriptional regulator/tetratricopeptide (TPR) repeat protein